VSRAVPHYVRIVDAPGQPARTYDCDSKREASMCASEMFRGGFVGTVASVFEGHADDGIERDPVEVWS